MTPPIELWICKTPEDLARHGAAFLRRQIQSRPRVNLSCATGATPVAAYSELAQWASQNPNSLHHVHWFHLDEYVGMSSRDPRSYAAYIQRHVLDPLLVPTENAHLWRGDAASPQDECTRYDTAIRDNGGIDCQILGLGMNGHIGFNEPDTPLDSRCHVVALTPCTLSHNAIHLEGGAMPTHAMTAGIATILEARRILMLVSGAKKAAAINRFFTAEISSEFPASFLRNHAHVTVMADAAAIAGHDQDWKGIRIHEAE